MGAAQRALPGGVQNVSINMPSVYVLISLKDNKKYIGSTTDLRRRLNQHNLGQIKSTKNRRPLKLYASQNFPTIKKATEFEKKYKKSHNFLEKMIKSEKFILINNRGIV